MGFHCNRYPSTIKHRVFFKTFCENIFKIHLLEILPDTYDSSNGVLLNALWDDSGRLVIFWYYGHWFHYFKASLVAPTLYILLCNKRHAG